MSDLERQDALQPDLLPDERSPQEIEREIERTRERMSSNIDALGDKLSPDALKQQAKDAISGKARDVAANVGDQARQTGSRVMDFITENPLPVAAVTLGAIWLFTHAEGEPGRSVGRSHGAVRLYRARAARAERASRSRSAGDGPREGQRGIRAPYRRRQSAACV